MHSHGAFAFSAGPRTPTDAGDAVQLAAANFIHTDVDVDGPDGECDEEGDVGIDDRGNIPDLIDDSFDEEEEEDDDDDDDDDDEKDEDEDEYGPSVSSKRLPCGVDIGGAEAAAPAMRSMAFSCWERTNERTNDERRRDK